MFFDLDGHERPRRGRLHDDSIGRLPRGLVVLRDDQPERLPVVRDLKNENSLRGLERTDWPQFDVTLPGMNYELREELRIQVRTMTLETSNDSIDSEGGSEPPCAARTPPRRRR